MRIFQEVPLPPTCYLAEATPWDALGRAPQVLVKVSEYGEDYSKGDPRTNRARWMRMPSFCRLMPGLRNPNFKIWA